MMAYSDKCYPGRCDKQEATIIQAGFVVEALRADLKRCKTVVEAAQEYRQKNESHMVQSPFARKLIKALAALDAPPEDETKGEG